MFVTMVLSVIEPSVRNQELLLADSGICHLLLQRSVRAPHRRTSPAAQGCRLIVFEGQAK